MLASSVVDRGFEPWSGQTKDYKIGICCFSVKDAALRRKSKDWLAQKCFSCFSTSKNFIILVTAAFLGGVQTYWI